MARLTLLLFPLVLAAQTEFQQAGVCARCHVVSVLEWGISKHRPAGTDCRGCHGPSAAHAVNERNEVSPDRLPREGAIAGLCRSCHAPGCPKTQQTVACQSCHHPHALVSPNQSGQAGGLSHNAGQAVPPPVRLAQEVVVAGFEMVLVPGGEFDMGSDLVHTVRVRAFYLGKFEVTQAQWRRVMGTNPSAVQGDDLPVERVSWVDAQAFVAKVNEQVTGGGFRLPTEAEWEYACQGCAPGWSRDNSSFRPQTVGGKPANRLGVHDLLGNVWEWCSSLARDYPYDPTDGRESLTAPGLRVLRGGSFADSAPYLDPVLRHSERPDRRLRWNGLRLARDAR